MVAHAGAALLTLLKDSDEVLEEVPANRIVGGELTPDLIAVMPTSALLVTEAGGTRPQSQAPIFRARIDVRAYNVSPWAASKLSVVAHGACAGTRESGRGRHDRSRHHPLERPNPVHRARPAGLVRHDPHVHRPDQ